jgi:acetylornithine deacetylase/succinyl-diaminopimelate desuccinylase-like protein
MRFGHVQAYFGIRTNAVALVREGIPTIGFGPGEAKLAHMHNENCEVRQIVDACAFYASLIAKL